MNIGGDSTNNTYAGSVPTGFTSGNGIPIGFAFNYFSEDRDSVYLSANGYIGFGNFFNAQGIDGPAYSTFATGALPNTSAMATLKNDGGRGLAILAQPAPGSLLTRDDLEATSIGFERRSAQDHRLKNVAFSARREL